jgi:demethylmenaquinone methyltransferase / 2-methoxy-6-polyprenyl-1,4-benzoquinol methylase
MLGAMPAAVDTDKSPEKIQEMFGQVAPVYDLLNHLLSLSLDRLWRRAAARAMAIEGEGPVLDLCSGTGDQAVALHRRGARVAAADFCLPMLALARAKLGRLSPPRPAPLAADALALPFADGTFAAATVSFGLRNVADLNRALSELCRVLRPGGQILILEFALPRGRLLGALYRFYFQHILPRVGRLVSRHASAYTYLPSSVMEFPQRRGFLEAMARAGFPEGEWRDLSAGTVCLYTGRAHP